MEDQRLKQVVEALLFISDRPVSVSELCGVLDGEDSERVLAVVNDLRQEYDSRSAGIQIAEIAGGYQMATRSEHGQWVRKLYRDKTTMRLSGASQETLSIIAYRQPITRAEIEEIRGVEVIASLETLLEKKLIGVVGRKDTVGRPLLYGTTVDFLKHFGLKSLDELPALEAFAPPREEPQAVGATAPPRNGASSRTSGDPSVPERCEGADSGAEEPQAVGLTAPPSESEGEPGFSQSRADGAGSSGQEKLADVTPNEGEGESA